MQFPHSHTLTLREKNGVPFYTFPAFDALPFIRHGISTRLGGVSQGILDFHEPGLQPRG